MPAGATKINGRFRYRRLRGQSTADLHGSNALKLALISGATEPDMTGGVSFWSDLASREISAATGYSAGGVALANVTVTLQGDGSSLLDADDAVFAQSASGFTGARWGIYYYSTGTNSTSEVIGSIDFGADQSNQTAQFSVKTPNGIGVF